MTSCLSTSSFLSCCISPATVSWTFEASSPWPFLRLSRYCASSSVSSSKVPSMRSVVVGPGIMMLSNVCMPGSDGVGGAARGGLFVRRCCRLVGCPLSIIYAKILCGPCVTLFFARQISRASSSPFNDEIACVLCSSWLPDLGPQSGSTKSRRASECPLFRSMKTECDSNNKTKWIVRPRLCLDLCPQTHLRELNYRGHSSGP